MRNLFWRAFLVIFLCGGLPAVAAADFRTRLSSQLHENRNLDDVRAEISFGRDVAARILGSIALLRNKELTLYLNRIGSAVAASSSRPDLAFHFAVLDTASVNAFAAPGGYIFVTRGALEAMNDEAELAAVLAHEIAHVSSRHIVNELQIRSQDTEGMSLVSLVAGSSDPVRVALHQMVDQAVNILFERGYKRQDEFESDTLATMLLVLSGYDPTSLRRYLQKISALQADEARELTQTHPPFSERIEHIKTFEQDNELFRLDEGTINQERFEFYVRAN
jgi:predicted Zn-dependent protease